MSCFENLTLHFGHNLPKNLHDATPPLSLSYSTGHTLTFEGFRQAEVTIVTPSSWVERGSPPTPSCRHGRKTRSIQADTNILTTLDTAKGAEITERKKKCDGVFHRTITNQVKPQSVAVILSRSSSYNNPRLEFHCLLFYYIAQQSSVYTSLGPRQTCPLLGLGLIHPDCSIFGIWSDLCCFEAWH